MTVEQLADFAKKSQQIFVHGERGHSARTVRHPAGQLWSTEPESIGKMFGIVMPWSAKAAGNMPRAGSRVLALPLLSSLNNIVSINQTYRLQLHPNRRQR